MWPESWVCLYTSMYEHKSHVCTYIPPVAYSCHLDLWQLLHYSSVTHDLCTTGLVQTGGGAITISAPPDGDCRHYIFGRWIDTCIYWTTRVSSACLFSPVALSWGTGINKLSSCMAQTAKLSQSSRTDRHRCRREKWYYQLRHIEC